MNINQWLRKLARLARSGRRIPCSRAWTTCLQVERLEARSVPALTTLASFNNANGSEPYGRLVMDSSGDLFGTTAQGGSSHDGTVFELLHGSTTVTTLATFNGTNGASPKGALVLDTAGDLFGTTSAGGSAGDGTVFEVVNGSGTITTLGTFSGMNGADPEAGLVLGNGALFGTTYSGGTSNMGTLFEVPIGSTTTISTVVNFSGSNGANPDADLVFDKNNNLFGTTFYGGGSLNEGTVFELPAGSTTLMTLAAFASTDGANPKGSLAVDGSGDVFGTASQGGNSYGAVFEIKQGAGVITPLVTFNSANGADPRGDLVRDSSGNLFGTTYSGGVHGFGTIFEIPQGTSAITTLAAFNDTDASPVGGLIEDSSANFFGAASGDNATSFGYGTIFVAQVPKITTPLLPDWTQNQAGYNQTITAGAGTGAFTFSASGQLPPGLMLSTLGLLSGAPVVKGTFTFTVTAIDGVSGMASQTYTVTINPPVSIVTTSLANWTANQPGYKATVHASGGTGAFTFTDNIPPGLNLDSTTGVISGDPTTPGTYSFSVTATDMTGAAYTENYTVVINQPPMITTASLSDWTVNEPGYSQTIGTTGGTSPLTFSSSGTLPPGLTLTTSGVVSGTPTHTGSYGFTVMATDMADASADEDYTVMIDPQPTELEIMAPTSTEKAGSSFSLTVDAQDGSGHIARGYSRTVMLSSSAGADISPTSVQLTNGTATAQVTLTAAVTQTITAALTGLSSGTASITVTPGALARYHLGLSGSGTVTAGSGVLVSVQAVDQYGNAISAYSGPASVTPTLSPSVAGAVPTTVPIPSDGLGLFLVTVPAIGTYTVTAASGSYTGNSVALTVTPGPAVKLGFLAQPVDRPTGIALPPVTVQILDRFGNVVTGDNTDFVTVGVSSGPGPFTSNSILSVRAQGGVAVFNNLILAVPGMYQLSAVVAGMYTGPYSAAFSVLPLQVLAGSFVGAPSGFALQFNAPYLVTATTPVLYGVGTGAAGPAPTIIVTTDPSHLNDRAAYVAGSLVPGPAPNSITFVATNTTLEGNNNWPILPDKTYTVIVRSSAATDGIQALYNGGGFLDGLGTGVAGSGEFVASFTVNAAAAKDDVLWVPATADGPGLPLCAPGMNNTAGGYPLYLDDPAGGVTQVQATLNYDPTLLNVTGVSGAGFSLLGSSMPGHAVLQYSGPPLPAGHQKPVGFILATVPSGTAANPMPYRAKDLLHLSGAQLNGGAVGVVTGDALHLVAYVGDANGDGTYSGDDAVHINRVFLQEDTGFPAYPLVDPVVVADTDGVGFLPADAPLQVNEAGVGITTANLPPTPIPPGVYFKLPSNNATPAQHLVVVAPRIVTLSAADAHPGSSLAGSWSIAVDDAIMGELGIMPSMPGSEHARLHLAYPVRGWSKFISGYPFHLALSSHLTK